MIDLKDYQDRLAIVTGAGDGIGRMLALGFAELGMRVAVLDIREEAAEAVSNEIGAAAFPLSADVSDRSAMETVAERLNASDEKPVIIWINAGVGIGAPILGGNPRTVEWGYGVNVLGAIWTAQTLVPLLLESERPAHVGVTASSASIRQPDAPLTLYAATKQATFGVGEALRAELAPHNIPVTILCPGLLNTNIWDAARARPDRFGGPRSMDPSISGQWREALTPDLMWPHIKKNIAEGGGYLVCASEAKTPDDHRVRSDAIASSIVMLD